MKELQNRRMVYKTHIRERYQSLHLSGSLETRQSLQPHTGRGGEESSTPTEKGQTRKYTCKDQCMILYEATKNTYYLWEALKEDLPYDIIVDIEIHIGND